MTHFGSTRAIGKAASGILYGCATLIAVTTQGADKSHSGELAVGIESIPH